MCRIAEQKDGFSAIVKVMFGKQAAGTLYHPAVHNIKSWQGLGDEVFRCKRSKGDWCENDSRHGRYGETRMHRNGAAGGEVYLPACNSSRERRDLQ